MTESELRRKWIDAIEKGTGQDFEYYTRRYMVCQLHFKTEDIKYTRSKISLKDEVVPSVFPSIQMYVLYFLCLFINCIVEHLCLLLSFTRCCQNEIDFKCAAVGVQPASDTKCVEETVECSIEGVCESEFDFDAEVLPAPDREETVECKCVKETVECSIEGVSINENNVG